MQYSNFRRLPPLQDFGTEYAQVDETSGWLWWKRTESLFIFKLPTKIDWQVLKTGRVLEWGQLSNLAAASEARMPLEAAHTAGDPMPPQS